MESYSRIINNSSVRAQYLLIIFVFELHLIKLLVETSLLNKLSMGACLGNLTLIQYDDPIGVPNCAKPMSYNYAGPVTEAINLGAVALRAKKEVKYDTASMKITNDDAANKYLTREYRKGWEI